MTSLQPDLPVKFSSTKTKNPRGTEYFSLNQAISRLHLPAHLITFPVYENVRRALIGVIHFPASTGKRTN